MVSVDVEVFEPPVSTGGEAPQLITVMRYSYCLLDKERVLYPPSGGWFIMWNSEPRHRVCTGAPKQRRQLICIACRPVTERASTDGHSPYFNLMRPLVKLLHACPLAVPK